MLIPDQVHSLSSMHERIIAAAACFSRAARMVCTVRGQLVWLSGTARLYIRKAPCRIAKGRMFFIFTFRGKIRSNSIAAAQRKVTGVKCSGSRWPPRRYDLPSLTRLIAV